MTLPYGKAVNFTHPIGDQNMSHKNISAIANAASLVDRQLQLEGVTERNFDAPYREIGELLGIEKIRIDPASSMMSVRYDATQVSLEVIEKLLEKYKISTSNSGFNRIKKHYYQFVDQNIIEQKSYKPVCCHKAPIACKKRGSEI